MLSGERATNKIPPEEHAMVQKLIDDTYDRFKEVVSEGRGAAHEWNKNGKDASEKGRALAENWAEFADGRVVSGKEALQHGAVDRAQKITGISDCNLVEYRERYDLSNFLSMFGQSDKAHDIKLELGADIPKLRAGCLYFLYQP